MITKELMETVHEKIKHLIQIEKISHNSAYNEVIITYWRYYDNLEEKLLTPNELTPYQSIDRVWRRDFKQEPGDETGVKEYVSWEKQQHRIEILSNGQRRIIDI
tara:strand:+ start:13906 stop:14217 length:312 start_codon:yes stop_codon:yes gene_type:complete